jgi:hypothetical protein
MGTRIPRGAFGCGCYDAKTDLTQNLAAISHSGHGLRLLVSVGMSVSQQGAAQALKYFFAALARDHDNDDANDVAFTETLAACGFTDAPPSRPSRRPRRRRPIDMGITFLSGRVSSVVMTTILEGIARTNNTPSSTTFRVCGLWFESNCTLAPTAVETLGERLGSQPSLELDMLQLDSTQNVLPRSLHCSLTAATETVRRVVMSDRDNSISAIASALRATELPSLEQLELACCANEDLAEWLAFGVFHVDSPSHVSSLSLRLRPRSSRDAWPVKSWIERFKAVLRDGISPGVLDSKEAATERLFVKLRATSAIKCAPHEGKKTVLKWSNGDDELEALGKADGKMAVVVPGVGIGWVPTDAIVHRRTEPSRVPVDKNTPLPTNQRVTSLTWCDPPSSKFWGVAPPNNVLVLSLLAIIGRPLTRLSLPMPRLLNDDVASILNLCPNLTELHISGNGSYDLTPFVDAHEAGQLSKLASLSIHLEQPAADGHSLLEQHLARLLKGDRPSRLTRLGIQIMKTHGMYGGHAREVVPMISILKSADKLEHIELRVSPSIYNELTSISEASKAIASKLAVRKKLALLSVVQAVQHGNNAIGRLDAAVLGVVFQYSCDWRLFLLTYY